jgi:hypothetical protein
LVSARRLFVLFAFASGGKGGVARQVRRVMAELDDRLASLALATDAAEAQA